MKSDSFEDVRTPWFAAVSEVTARAARFLVQRKSSLLRLGLIAVPAAVASFAGLQTLAAAPFVLGGAYAAWNWDSFKKNKLKAVANTAFFSGAALAICYACHISSFDGQNSQVHAVAKHYYKLAQTGKASKTPGKTVIVNCGGASYEIKPGNASGRFSVTYEAPSFWTGSLVIWTNNYDLARPRYIARLGASGPKM